MSTQKEPNSNSSNSVGQDHSISTDSEESFLMKQLNKSQLFNNSSSSGSSSAKYRKSFFKETYIDEEGNTRPFSVFTDVINETSDESRDLSLSGLSSFNIENINNTVLGELDANKSGANSGSIERKPSVARSGSRREHSKKSPSIKRYSGASFRMQGFRPKSTTNSSTYSSYNPSLEIVHPKPMSHQYNYSTTHHPRISTPEFPAPPPPSQHEPEVPMLSEDVTVPRIPTPEFRAPPPPPMIHTEEAREGDADVNPNKEMENLEGFQPRKFNLEPRKQRSSSTLNSYKSAKSTRESVLEYERSRKTYKGTPKLLLSSSESRLNVTFNPNVSSDARQSHADNTAGVSPSLYTPSTMQFSNNDPMSDDVSVKEFKKARMTSGASLLKKPIGPKEMKGRPGKYLDMPNDDERYKSLEYPKDDDYSFPNDALLEKIHYYRKQPVRDQGNNGNMIGWLLYLISFIIPPLFFFLGFGLLDQHTGRIDSSIKKLSLITGIFVLLVALAMIGVGFGVGITKATS